MPATGSRAARPRRSGWRVFEAVWAVLAVFLVFTGLVEVLGGVLLGLVLGGGALIVFVRVTASFADRGGVS